MTTIARAEHIYLTEPDFPLCAQCGAEAPEPDGDNEPQCEPCRQQTIRDNMSNHLDAPFRELAALVSRMQHMQGCGFEGDGREWLEWARELRGRVPEICESLDAFAEEMEMGR